MKLEPVDVYFKYNEASLYKYFIFVFWDEKDKTKEF